jgi:membrane protein implicated in regulation of membrane protease activity
MAEWWNALDLLQQIFLCAAVPFTLLLLVQTVLTFVGLGGHEDGPDGADMSDFDAHDFDAHDVGGHDAGADIHDGHDGHDAGDAVGGFRFFTVRGIVAFFCIFGWTGFALSDTALPPAAMLIISFFAGLLAMLLIGLMFYAVRRMQDNGNLRYSNAIGQEAKVYIPVPAQRAGSGKVLVTIQERLVEADAVTDEESRITTGSPVKVVGSIGNTLIVKR